ncbi:MAG: DUF1730 domain-containing protein [bacterium]|nr:DUF1730 domain-containing protein [bacterium]
MSIENRIVNISKILGFEYCSIARIRDVEELVNRIKAWIEKGYSATMKWMEKKLLMKEKLKDYKSCIVVLKNYYTNNKVNGFSKYSIYEDYHVYIKKRLKIIEKFLLNNGARKVFSSVDTSFISEKFFAALTDAGFICKSTMLISRHLGAFTLIGEVF